MNNKILLASSLLLGLAACGDNLDNNRPDARPRVDGSTADASDIDAAMIDAAGSTVTVTAGACAPIVHTLVTAGPSFTFDGTTGNPPIVLTVGETISFATAGLHNFESAPGTPASMTFESGAPGAQTVCLTFTAAGGPIDYQCQNHPTTMTNTLTVNP